MAERELDAAGDASLDQALGYLNFSSGTSDPLFLARINALFGRVAQQHPQAPAWQEVGNLLKERLEVLSQSAAAFSDAEQARAVVALVFDETLPAYREYHRDLLFHQTDASLLRPFFIGRVCEAVLRQGPPWSENDRIVPGAIIALNDFLGHRPVATLETQKIEPYRHEYVRPVPLFLRGAGVTYGLEHEVVTAALKLLEDTDADLLRSACYNPAHLDELSVDPRAYDFDHPANKRPNYHFGQWDPHQIDNQGRYRRFVVQQVTLDALMHRLHEAPQLAAEELLFEAAAVLAGTVLMASGISGEGPATFDSTTTLAKLLPRIAKYRDEFYERLFKKTTGEHAERLRVEAAERRQPFGGARQHLNAQLARRRASQLEHVHLARIFARMGNVEAAARQANIVPCASARILCTIDCLLSTGTLACDRGQLEDAAGFLPQVMDLLRRGISCGAIIDPWNILGFDANFSLFPALENSVRDHRADELVSLMDRILAFYSRIWSEAAAVDNKELCKKVSRQFKETATWWQKYAAHEVSSVEAVDPFVVYRAAEGVAQALNVWHKGGAATGDVAFWAPHAEMFDSPKAYALVIDSLLDRKDYVASMALLMHWLSQAESIGLERSDSSFHDLVERWYGEVTSLNVEDAALPEKALKAWDSARKFVDYLEANADVFWQAPQFQLGSGRNGNGRGTALEIDEEENEGLYDSAYEEVVYRDSTDDGNQGAVWEDEDATHDELLSESKRVADRLSFLATVARLWRLSAVSPILDAVARDEIPATRGARLAALERWIEQAETNRTALDELLASVRDYRIPAPLPDHDSLIEYDRRRMTKESLLERIVSTSVETTDAGRLLSAAVMVLRGKTREETPGSDEEQRRFIEVFAALLQAEPKKVRSACDELWKALSEQPLLYVPLAKGGAPAEIVAVRTRQHGIQDLLSWLPRLGLWVETCELLEVARQMEKDHPVGAGAVTEYDELFKIGYKGIVESLVASAMTWPTDEDSTEDQAAEPLVACLEQLTESMLSSWLAHSRTLRLSILERVHEKGAWKRMVEFVERYGEELFTQRFLNLGNIRAILHQGTGAWLQSLQEDPHDDVPEKLIADLETELTRDEAAEQLALVLEAVVENYGEYRDYNSTTTQSDRGELLYTLLDFLRLRTKYDRVCWNLKPVVLAHETLVRRGREAAARVWRKALSERIHDEADQYLAKLADLQKKYAMRMPTVADRLAERFVRPLSIDRIRALVEPAVAQIRCGGKIPKFELLEEETELLTREPTGVGLDVPAWLVALEEEVENVLRPIHERRRDEDLAMLIPATMLTLRQARKQLKEWTNRQK